MNLKLSKLVYLRQIILINFMLKQVKAIGDILEIVQNKPTNQVHWQIFLMKKAWKKIGLPANPSLNSLYIKEKKLFVQITSLSLKHYVVANHDAILASLNQEAREMSKRWVNLHKIILINY